LYVYYSLSDDRIERLLEVLFEPPQHRSTMERVPVRAAKKPQGREGRRRRLP
jgi:hypothetical protein